MRENKQLTGAIAKAIDDYTDKNPDVVTVGMIVVSFVAIWRSLFKRLPRSPRSRFHDGTPGSVMKPPRIADVVTA